MNAEQWDGPIQDAIHRHDEELGHWPPRPHTVAPASFFHRPTRPNGGTVHVDWFRRAPTGGGTVYAQPSGNPYDESLPEETR